jgi:uncharacterized tellurite resistance protein B-like protein
VGVTNIQVRVRMVQQTVRPAVCAAGGTTGGADRLPQSLVGATSSTAGVALGTEGSPDGMGAPTAGTGFSAERSASRGSVGDVPFRLSRDSFLAITAVAWADGLLRAKETKALLRAAEAAGLDGDDLAAVQQATQDGVSLDDVSLGDLTGWERAVTYAIAYWLAKVDGVVNAEELKHLRALGAKLELPQPKLDAAASAAFDVACLPGGHRPEKYDFMALADRLREKLPALSRDVRPE